MEGDGGDEVGITELPTTPPGEATQQAQGGEQQEQALQALGTAVGLVVEGASDEERFAGLLLITHAVATPDHAVVRRVYDGIGLAFVSRLVLSGQWGEEQGEQGKQGKQGEHEQEGEGAGAIPDDAAATAPAPPLTAVPDANMICRVGFSVLATFMQLEGTAEDGLLLLPAVADAFVWCARQARPDPGLVGLLSDLLVCMHALAQAPAGRLGLLQDSEAVDGLLRLLTGGPADAATGALVMQTLSLLTAAAGGSGPHEPAAVRPAPSQTAAVVGALSRHFRASHDDSKLAAMSTLAWLLRDLASGLPAGSSTRALLRADGAEWPADLRAALSDMIRTKLNPGLRRDLLAVVQFGCELRGGVGWLVGTGTGGADGAAAPGQGEAGAAKPRVPLLCLVAHMASIELRMSLEDRSMEQVLEEGATIGSCLALIEQTIVFLAGMADTSIDAWPLDLDAVLKLKTPVDSSAAAVVYFLLAAKEAAEGAGGGEASKQEAGAATVGVEAMTAAAIRLLSVWLAEETDTGDTQLLAVMPYVLTLACQPPSAQPAAPAGSTATAEDHLTALLPCLCNLAQNSDVRKLMLRHGLCRVLADRLVTDWLPAAVAAAPLERPGRPFATEDCHEACSALLAVLNLEAAGKVLDVPTRGALVDAAAAHAPLLRDREQARLFASTLALGLMASVGLGGTDAGEGAANTSRSTLVAAAAAAIQQGALSAEAAGNDAMAELWGLSLAALLGLAKADPAVRSHLSASLPGKSAPQSAPQPLRPLLTFLAQEAP